MAQFNVISVSENPITVIIRGIILFLMVQRAYSHKSLTLNGTIAAFITGLIHSLPKSNLYLTLLLTFYITSSKATKYKEEIKSKLTAVPKNSSPASSSASQRTHIQVLANSGIATAFILISLFTKNETVNAIAKTGIISQYVAVISDTWSSELGILSKSSPILITTFQKVPPGTNGGVTTAGLLSGLSGSALISAISAFTYESKQIEHFIYFTLIGLLGTIIDSILGAIFQYSLVNEQGLVLEPLGGEKIEKTVLMEEKDKLKKVSGVDMLSNNHVNLLMSLFTVQLSIGIYLFLFS